MSLSSTSDIVKSSLVFNDILTKDQYNTIKTLDIDFNEVLTKQFVDDSQKNTDFGHNIITVQQKIKNDICDKSDVGMICYMIYKTFFNVDTKNDNIEYILPEWDKGYRITDINVTFQKEVSFEGYYGLTHIYSFVTDDNIRLQWFSTVDLDYRMDGIKEGESFLFRGSVKELKEDKKYGNSVIVTRVILKRY
jgi:hypothetical protein